MFHFKLIIHAFIYLKTLSVNLVTDRLDGMRAQFTFLVLFFHGLKLNYGLFYVLDFVIVHLGQQFGVQLWPLLLLDDVLS